MSVNEDALTTLARLKTYMGISGTTHDTVLELIINVVSDVFKTALNRTLIQTIYTNEVYDGSGTRKLILRNAPVISTSPFTLQVRSSIANVDSWDSLDSSLFYVDYNAGIIELISGIFVGIPRHYRITYTAGYNFSNSDGGNTLESQDIGDLEQAFWETCKKVFKDRKVKSGIQSESIGDYSVTYATKLIWGDPLTKAVIQKYKRGRALF